MSEELIKDGKISAIACGAIRAMAQDNKYNQAGGRDGADGEQKSL